MHGQLERHGLGGLGTRREPGLVSDCRVSLRSPSPIDVDLGKSFPTLVETSFEGDSRSELL